MQIVDIGERSAAVAAPANGATAIEPGIEPRMLWTLASPADRAQLQHGISAVFPGALVVHHPSSADPEEAPPAAWIAAPPAL